MGSHVALTIHVRPEQHLELFQRGQVLGRSPKHLAEMMFNAAYHARKKQEAGEAPDDIALDEQVRLVFACAGQGDTVAIARATGIPEYRVARILDAWRQAGQEPAPVARANGELRKEPTPSEETPVLTDKQTLIFLAIAERAIDGPVKIPNTLLQDACSTSPPVLIKARDRIAGNGLVSFHFRRDGAPADRGMIYELTQAGRDHYAELSGE